MQKIFICAVGIPVPAALCAEWLWSMGLMLQIGFH
jgi:hypothetical protein